MTPCIVRLKKLPVMGPEYKPCAARNCWRALVCAGAWMPNERLVEKGAVVVVAVPAVVPAVPTAFAPNIAVNIAANERIPARAAFEDDFFIKSYKINTFLAMELGCFAVIYK